MTEAVAPTDSGSSGIQTYISGTGIGVAMGNGRSRGLVDPTCGTGMVMRASVDLITSGSTSVTSLTDEVESTWTREELDEGARRGGSLAAGPGERGLRNREMRRSILLPERLVEWLGHLVRGFLYRTR